MGGSGEERPGVRPPRLSRADIPTAVTHFFETWAIPLQKLARCARAVRCRAEPWLDLASIPFSFAPPPPLRGEKCAVFALLAFAARCLYNSEGIQFMCLCSTATNRSGVESSSIRRFQPPPPPSPLPKEKTLSLFRGYSTTIC